MGGVERTRLPEPPTPPAWLRSWPRTKQVLQFSSAVKPGRTTPRYTMRVLCSRCHREITYSDMTLEEYTGMLMCNAASILCPDCEGRT